MNDNTMTFRTGQGLELRGTLRRLTRSQVVFEAWGPEPVLRVWFYDRKLAQSEVDRGLVYRGLVAHRDLSTVARAASYLEMSYDIRNAQPDDNAFGLPSRLPAYL
jgi:hypothetical protein